MQDDTALVRTPTSSGPSGDMDPPRSRQPSGRPGLERRHSFGARGRNMLGHKRQLSNSTPDRLTKVPNKHSIAPTRNPTLFSPPRVLASGGPYAFYDDRLGTLVQEMVESLQQCRTWKEFVDKQRGRSYLHQDVGAIPHPAATFLEDLRVNGVPAKTTEPDL